MAKFTTKEYIDKLRKDIKELQKINRPLALAASTAHNDYVDRIFNEGKTSKGADITIKKSTVTPREGAYSRGYARRRQQRGRQINKVNLVFEGLLFGNIANSLQQIQDKWVTGTTRKEESDKVDHLIELYGEDVFKLSKEERQKAVNIAQKEYAKIMQ